MEWIRGGPLPGAAFQIDQAKFTLPPEVTNRPEVIASGIGMLMRKEGFKDIPPVVQRTPDGAFILNRPSEAFELLVEHLLGLEPLTRVPLHLFADKYIALKSELTFWQLPTGDVPFHDHIYFETAWTDEHCLFPLAPIDAAAFKREKTDEPAASRRAVLQAVSERPEELSEELLGAGDRRAHEGEESPPPAERWNFFIFDASGGEAAAAAADKPATPSRLVFAVGVKGPVPNVFTFDLPNASAVRFYPWGAMVVNGEVELLPKRRLASSEVTKSQVAAAASSAALAERRRSSDDNVKRLMTFLPGQQQQGPREPGETGEAPLAPAKPVVVASILRTKQKVVKPIEKIYLINTDHETVRQYKQFLENALTLKHGVDYDVLDMRDKEGTDFEVVVSVRGGLACRMRGDFQETKRNDSVAVVSVDGSGRLATHARVLIKNGAPQGEMLRSLTLTGEYSISDRQYYKFEVGTKLFEFHRSLYMLRSSQSAGACSIM